MLLILLIPLLSVHLVYLSSCFPSTADLLQPYDQYADPSPGAWQSDVLCGPYDRDVGFDSGITQRLTAQFCTDLLGYPISPGQTSLGSCSPHLLTLCSDEEFNASYYPTDLQPLPGQDPTTVSNPFGFGLLVSFETSTTFPLNGSNPNCSDYLNNCTNIFNETIGLCQYDSHWVGGTATYSSECGVYKFENTNCTLEWLTSLKGGPGLTVGAECTRWVRENHPDQ
jgi:hypothetical protein